MRVLLLNQFFAPDSAPTGQLLADVARALVAEGHTVQVLCSRSAYRDLEQVGDHGLEQVSISRIGASLSGYGRVSRLCSYGFFFVAALVRTLLQRRADVVVTLTTPPLLSLVGTAAKYLRGCRHLIWEMDIYPDVAVGVGVFRSGRLPDRFIGALADFSRRSADHIVTLGSCMRARLIRRGIAADKISVAENWADSSMISPRPFPNTTHLTLLYSGNLGRAHDFDTIGKAAKRLSDPEILRFVFAGGGSRQARLRAVCGDQANTEFLPHQPHSLLAEHLGRCHVGLVTQSPGTLGTVVPSKTYTLMAAGRPFIFIGPGESTLVRLIEQYQCGWHIEPGNHSGLATLLCLLQASPELVHAAGARARNAFLRSSDVQMGSSRILNIVAAMVEVRNPIGSAAASA